MAKFKAVVDMIYHGSKCIDEHGSITVIIEALNDKREVYNSKESYKNRVNELQDQGLLFNYYLLNKTNSILYTGGK